MDWRIGVLFCITLSVCISCSRATRKRSLWVLLDKDITSVLQNGDDIEDGLDVESDSLEEPDFVPELETSKYDTYRP